jgi:hypothetical protein
MTKIKSLNLPLSKLRQICGSDLGQSVFCYGYGAYYCSMKQLANTEFMALENCRFQMFEFDAESIVVSTICVELYFSVN